MQITMSVRYRAESKTIKKLDHILKKGQENGKETKFIKRKYKYHKNGTAYLLHANEDVCLEIKAEKQSAHVSSQDCRTKVVNPLKM
jgi:hypothetical protein